MSIATAFFDAADAPGLRARVAELEAETRRKDGIIAELERQLELERKTAIFYYGLHAERQPAMIEDAWGIPGGGD
jgi:hypothetical protein